MPVKTVVQILDSLDGKELREDTKHLGSRQSWCKRTRVRG